MRNYGLQIAPGSPPPTPSSKPSREKSSRQKATSLSLLFTATNRGGWISSWFPGQDQVWDWLQYIKLDWSCLHRLSDNNDWQEVTERHADLFKDELGVFTGVEAKLHMDPQVKPQFYRARPVPYALKTKVEEELDRLEREGVIEKIKSSEWAAPIVPVMKPDGSIRICGDYKLTANRATKTELYPLPRAENIFASLAGGKLFTTLDLAHAYNQIPLDEESQKLVVINTSKGLYKYKRLPFDIASAPAIFQRTLENLLHAGYSKHFCLFG